MRLRLPAVLSALVALPALAATPEQWRTRSIYQVLTDRFAVANGSTTVPCDTGARRYCGGSYRGIIEQLDYIQGMGFTAVGVLPSFLPSFRPSLPPSFPALSVGRGQQC